MNEKLFFILIILGVILVFMSIICSIISFFNSDIYYEVVTFDNEIIKVKSYELYKKGMYIYKDDEKTLIKSYRRLE